MVKQYHRWEFKVLHPEATHIRSKCIEFRLCSACGRLEIIKDNPHSSGSEYSEGLVIEGNSLECRQAGDSVLDGYPWDITSNLITQVEYHNYVYQLQKENKKATRKKEREQIALSKKYERYLKKLNALTYDEWLKQQA